MIDNPFLFNQFRMIYYFLIGFSIRLFYLINIFCYFYYTFSLFIFVELIIVVNPYLAVKIYQDNQNIWQDCYAITYG